MEVQTVTAPVGSADLGFTLMHEHVISADPEIMANYPGWWDEAADVAAAHAELTRVAGLGVGTLVDLTVIGLGRDVGRVREIATSTGLKVIAATGVYAMDQLPRFFTRRGPHGRRLLHRHGPLRAGHHAAVAAALRDRRRPGRRGYAAQMVLSHDTHCFSLSWDRGVRARMLPDWHLGFISTGVLPRLLKLGVSPEQIDQMMVANPRDIFSRGGSY